MPLARLGTRAMQPRSGSSADSYGQLTAVRAGAATRKRCRTVREFAQLRAALLGFTSLALSALASGADNPHHQTRLEGSGANTVIFEAGLGDTLEVWDAIQPRVAEHCARTVAYNRAGYVGSDAADGPRDAATIVAELRTELQARGVAPPYVLVGHSLGGLYMQYFARNYPNEVAGLVLLDSTHWDQGMHLDKSANAPYSTMHAVTLFMTWIARRELADSAAAGEQVHASPPAGTVPTEVLSSSVPPRGETPSAHALETQRQDEIAADFPRARHVWVQDSGHYIQRDRPDAVIDAVRRLASCTPESTRGRLSAARDRAQRKNRDASASPLPARAGAASGS